MSEYTERLRDDLGDRPVTDKELVMRAVLSLMERGWVLLSPDDIKRLGVEL